MIQFIDKKYSDKVLYSVLSEPVRKWFEDKFGSFCLTQKLGLMNIHSRKNTLISAPTGSGKTLTAFLSILNELIDLSIKGLLKNKTYAVYCSPLKALNKDIQFNLIGPLREIEAICEQEFGIRVLIRSGDTTPYEKSKMLKKPPHILVTTPESLAIVMSSIKFKEHLTEVNWVIIDEIHSLAEGKRGVHLSLTIERLRRLTPYFTRIGLSATISPLEEIAKYLVGYEKKKPKQCDIVDIKYLKEMDLKVVSPVNNIVSTDYQKLHTATYKMLHDYIQKHVTTLIFTNTRAGTERVVDTLKDLYPKCYTESNIGAHHGSLSKEHRDSIESNLRKGKFKCVVTSTSLELGIDIGFIDLVILLGSPKSVARALQRTGRAGHQLKSKSKGRLIVQNRDDLVECALLLKNAIEHKIDRINIPKNALDVLSQHVVGIAVNEKISVDELFDLVRSSYCYQNLDYNDFIEVIKFLAGHYVSLEERRVYAKIWYDEEQRMIGRRGRMVRVIYMTNIGTIPDQTGISVRIGNQPIGTIDEAFLEKLKQNDVFVLGGSTYIFKHSKGQVAYVSATASRPPTVPSWHSEMLPLTYDLAMEIGKFRRLMSGLFCANKSEAAIKKFIDQYLYVDEKALNAIYEYFREQFDYKTIPSDKRIIIEHYNDDRGKYVIFHCMYGRRVNDCLSRVVGFAISRKYHRDVDIGINDNGFYIRTVKMVNAVKAFKMIKADEVRQILENAIEKTEILKRRFRHCASRALMILRSYKGHQKWVGRRQVDSMILLSAVRRISNDFVILKEARREVLEDLMDISNTENVIRGIEDKKIKVEEIYTDIPSPFAFNLVIQGYTDILRMDDKHEFLKRMHRMVLAKIYLKNTKEKSKEKSKPFDYMEYFKEEEEIADEAKELAEEKLIESFSKTARKVGMDANLIYEGIRFLKGETEGFRIEFADWVRGFIDGKIPKVWNKNVVEYFKDNKRRVI